MSALVSSPQVKSRLLVLTAALFAVLAILSWWMVIEDGPSPARLLAAIAATVGAIIQTAIRKRGLGGRGSRSTPESD